MSADPDTIAAVENSIVDSADIDLLEEIEAHRKPFDGQLSIIDIDRLIVAVEVLRERVAELEALQWRHLEQAGREIDKFNKMKARATVAQDSNKDMREALEVFVTAWEALPGNRRYRPAKINLWLNSNMKLAIAAARAVLVKAQGVDS